MAKLYNAGNAYLQILPSFKGIERLMQRETAKLAREIDKAMGQGVNDSLTRAFRDVDTDQIARGGRTAADKWSNQFERRLTQGLKDMAKDLPTVQPKADLDEFDKALADTKREIADLARAKITPGQGGTGGLDAIGSKLDEITDRMTRLSDEAVDADRKLQLRGFARQAELLGGLVDEARNSGRDSGREFGGAFAKEAQQTIQNTLRDLPEVEIDADSTPAQRELAEFRARLEALGDQKIGIDIDQATFNRQLAGIEMDLYRFRQQPHQVGLQFDLDAAARSLRGFTDKVQPVLDPQAEELGRRGGERFAGAYATTVEQRIRGAIEALPIPIRVDDSEAQRTLIHLRTQLEALVSQRIGVDVDAATADATIRELRRQLEALDRDDVDIDVRTNAAAAAASLALLDRNTNDASVSMHQLGQDAGITMSRLGYMIAIGASLGSLVAPAAATAAVAIAGIGTAALGVLSGLGVLALGLAGIGDTVKKIDAYQQDANKSSKSFAQAQNQMVTATDAVRDAERNLTQARQDAADGAEQAQERIADAQRAAERAARDAAEAVVRARRSEQDAVRDLGRARVDAAETVRRAVESQEDAERDLARAVKDQKTARLELNEAIRDAVDDLRELNTAVKRNALDVDEATTASMKAKQEYDKLISNPRATEIEKRLALEAYRDKIIQIEELTNKGNELRKQAAAAAKEGVESTDRVKKARQAVATADQRAADAARRLDNARRSADRARIDASDKVAKAEQRVADAHAATAKAQRDGAERVADAQRSVADAQKAAARQQQQSQRQILQATEAVTKAQRGLATASTAAGTAGGEAFDNMNDALNNLSPAGQRFAKWLYGLKPLLAEIRASAQEGLLPGLQDSLQTLIDNYFPAFNRFVSKIAAGLGGMFSATAKILTNPQWRAFFQFIDQTALPSLTGAWVASLNLARGVANIVRALNPLAAPIGQGLVEMTEKFARWSDRLETSTGFRAFLDYAARVGPKVVNLVEQMVDFIGRLVIAAAPMGEMILDLVTGVFEFINSWDLGTLQAVVEIVAVLGTTIWLLTGFVRVVKFAVELWNAVTLIATKAQQILAAAVARYQAATVGATASTGFLSGALFEAGTAGTAGAAGMGAMTAAAGPLAVAILLIGGAWYLVQRAQQKADEATDSLTDGLVQLGEAYRKAAESAGTGSADVIDSLKKIVAQNEDLQRAVITLTQLGISLEDIGSAANGSAEQLDRVLAVITDRIAQMKKQMEEAQNAADENGLDLDAMDDEIRRLEKMRDKFGEAAAQAHVASDAMGVLNQSTNDLADSTAYLTPSQQALAEAQRVLGDASSTTKDKIDALTKAQDLARQSAIDAIEAEESWESSLDQLTTSVKAAIAADDKHAKSLSVKTATGRNNRDMLEQLIASADRMYDADVALNGVTQAAITKGQGHYNQIRAVAKQLGLGKTATDNLIKSYGKIPRNVETAIGFKQGQFDKMFQQLEQAAFIQKGLKDGKDIDKVRAEYKAMISDRNRAKAHGWATGGPIAGPGITGGKTEDANLILASRGEFMQPADAVDYYGPGFMEAVRRKKIPRDMFQGLAAGGPVGTQKWNYPIDLSKVWIPSAEDIQGYLFGKGIAGVLGGLAGGGGWKWQMNVLRKRFKGLSLYSGFRPGARTPSGNVSWHARGRAVDVPPRHDVFNWIHDNYGKKTQELIWLGDKYRNIQHGKHHVYDNALLQQHGVAGMPNAHIHWAYDKGGMLPPGYTHAFNGTGKPEAVLTNTQWQTIADLARTASNAGGGNTYNYEFRDTTLDPSKVNAMQAREAALARAGRAR